VSGPGSGTRVGSEAPPAVTPSLLKRFSHGSLTYGIGSILQQGTAFLLIPVYTNVLDPSEYGIVGVVLAIFSASSVILGLGLRGAVTRQYFDHAEEPARLREYLGSVYSFLLLYGVVGAGLLTLFGRRLFTLVLGQIPFQPFVPLALWAAFFAAARGPLLSLYRAREQAGRYAALEFGSGAFLLIFVIYFVVVQDGGAIGQARGVFWGSFVAFAVVLALLWREGRPCLNLPMVRSAIAFGLPLTFHLFANWVLLAADRMLLVRMVPLEEVGYYTLGYQLAMIIGVVTAAVNSAWSPIFYDVAHNNDRASDALGQLATVNIGLGFSAAFLVILFGTELVALVGGGSAYEGAAQVIPAIALGYAFQGLYLVAVTPIFFSRNTALLAPITLTAAAVNIGANLLLIPVLGIAGAAWATMVAFGILFLGAFITARKHFTVDYETGRILFLGGFLVLAAAIVWGAGSLSTTAALSVKAAAVLAFVFALHRTEVLTRLRSGLLPG
jgi:O-antigen/teichoic acid export membrane protein